MGLWDTLKATFGFEPPEPDVLKSAQSDATLTGIRQIISGHPEEGLTPQRLARIMKGAEMGDVIPALELAEAMEEKYLHYRSVMATRKLAVSSLPITVTAASTEAPDQRAADIMREVAQSSCLRAGLFDMMDACGKGFSVSEIIWDQQATDWRPGKICHRLPQWFIPDRIDGTTILLRGGPGDGANSLIADPAQLARGNFGTPLPYGKYVAHIHKSKSGTVMRGALSRPAAWAYLFQNFTVKSWAIFLEVYGHPLRIGKYDNSASSEQKKILLRAVRDISADAAAIIPATMSIDFESASVTGNSMHMDNLNWWNNQVSKLVLGQTGTSDTAAYAGTANAHEHVRDDISDDDAAQLAATIQRDVAGPLTAFNVAGAKPPIIAIGEPESLDVTALCTNVKTFVSLGGKVGASWLGAQIGIPEPDEGDVLLTSPAPTPMPGTGDPEDDDPEETDPEKIAANVRLAVATALAQAAAPVNDALDTLQAQQLADWHPLAKPLIDPVMELLEACSSLEEFQARLPGVLKDQDPAKLATTIAQTSFAARLAGLTGAPIKGK